jgi:N-methylhydantoinase A
LPTVTDAHLVLGHFGGEGLLGGDFALDESRARSAIETLARDMSAASGKRCSIEYAAEGVLAVANTNMEGALRHISVERGHDPRQFALLPFGGAGGLHAVDLARSLRIPAIIVPNAGGTLSALGVLAADVIKDQSRTVMLAPHELRRLERSFKEMEREASRILRREGFAESKQLHERSLAMRYRGQSFELDIAIGKEDLTKRFHRAHRERYGYAQDSAVEIVSARLRSFGLVVRLPKQAVKRSRQKRTVAPSHYHLVRMGGKKMRVGVYRREQLPAGVRLRTPCIVIEYSATTLVPDYASASIDNNGNLILTLDK